MNVQYDLLRPGTANFMLQISNKEVSEESNLYRHSRLLTSMVVAKFWIYHINIQK